jgi:hypothetical protein
MAGNAETRALAAEEPDPDRVEHLAALRDAMRPHPNGDTP